VHSDWFFLGQDFAIQTVSKETVIRHVIFGSSVIASSRHPVSCGAVCKTVRDKI